MQVPTLHYRKANESEDKGFAPMSQASSVQVLSLVLLRRRS
jgi:hypothetical protein